MHKYILTFQNRTKGEKTSFNSNKKATWDFAQVKEFYLVLKRGNRGIKDLRRDDSDNATNLAYLMNKDKTFARSSHAFIISVHFFPVLDKSATWKDQFFKF